VSLRPQIDRAQHWVADRSSSASRRGRYAAAQTCDRVVSSL